MVGVNHAQHGAMRTHRKPHKRLEWAAAYLTPTEHGQRASKPPRSFDAALSTGCAVLLALVCGRHIKQTLEFCDRHII